MIFARLSLFSFPPSSPSFFRSEAAIVTKCARWMRARAGRGERTSRERTCADALTTYRSRLPFFSVRRVPELSARSRRSIFSRFTLNHKYKSQEHRESIEITGRTLLFCFRVVEACRMCVCTYTHTYACIYVCASAA
jgi:hypothetical protein